MTQIAATRRPAPSTERQVALNPRRRPDGWSAFKRQLAVGAYVTFMVAASAFVAGGTVWDSIFGGSQSAILVDEVAGQVMEPEAAEAESSEILPEIIHLSLPLEQTVSQPSTAQQLAVTLETVAPAPISPTSVPYVSRGIITGVNITFYDCASQGFCGAMYNGRKVYEGAAACSWNLAIGTKFVIVGDPTHRIYTCEDRGLLSNTWVDIFWYYPSQGHSWQSIVGRYGTIEIVHTP